MSAPGIAAYALVMGLLRSLEDRGDLPRAAIIDVLDGALAAIEDIATDDADVRLARRALRRCTIGCFGGRIRQPPG